MKKVIVLLIFIGQIISSQAQDTEYEYVRVPEKFDFLNEKNKFELNALTAFLFDKYGFKVLYKENPPENTHPCQILAADIQNNSGWFQTKLVVTLEDCNQNIVFTSEEGDSRTKDYKKAYHEALREAFESLNSFNPEAVASRNITKAPVTEKRGLETNSSEEEDKEAVVSAIPAGLSSGRTFRNGEQLYHLRKRSSGYELYRTGEEEKFAALLMSGNGTNYIYSSENLQGNAFFDPSGNLVVEYLDSNTGQLVSVKYELQD